MTDIQRGNPGVDFFGGVFIVQNYFPNKILIATYLIHVAFIISHVLFF